MTALLKIKLSFFKLLSSKAHQIGSFTDYDAFALKIFSKKQTVGLELKVVRIASVAE